MTQTRAQQRARTRTQQCTQRQDRSKDLHIVPRSIDAFTKAQSRGQVAISPERYFFLWWRRERGRLGESFQFFPVCVHGLIWDSQPPPDAESDNLAQMLIRV